MIKQSKPKYHITINSFCLIIDKVRYSNDQYIKCIVSYCYKNSGTLFAREKNVKIYKDTMKHWEIYE